jgi:hypothetical protein
MSELEFPHLSDGHAGSEAAYEALEAMCVGGAEPAKAIAQCRECGRKEKGKFAKCAGRRRGISCVTTVV